MPDFEYENTYWNQGHTIVGIDEVGRGCLAGPITLGACVIPRLHASAQSQWLSIGINDSKKLTPLKRREVVNKLKDFTCKTYTTSVGVETINSLGIMHAWRVALVEILSKLRLDYPKDVFTLLVDGPAIKDIPYKEPVHTISIVKGDTKSIAIAAASVVAKVTRDTYMEKLSTAYPEYGWEKNKGYGTLSHCEAIKAHGISPWHRTLFVRSLVG